MTGAQRPPATTHPAVLVVGASRGLGAAVVEEYAGRGAQVVATVRGDAPTPVQEVADRAGGAVEIEHVDISRPGEISDLARRLGGRRFDLLFVVAGIQLAAADASAASSSDADFTAMMITNVLGAIRAVEELGELVDPAGTIAVMSSGQGSITNNTTGGFEIYRATKAALNQLMRSYAARRAGEARTLLLMAPGWVKHRTGRGGCAVDRPGQHPAARRHRGRLARAHRTALPGPERGHPPLVTGAGVPSRRDGLPRFGPGGVEQSAMDRLGNQRIADARLTDWRKLAQGLAARFVLDGPGAAPAFVSEIHAVAEDVVAHADVRLARGVVDIALCTRVDGRWVTDRDVELARAISAVAAARGARPAPAEVTQLELALDTVREEAVAPFWAALLTGSTDNRVYDSVFDPTDRIPSAWFQRTDLPGPVPQRWHFDLWLAPEAAAGRIAAAVAAGGTVVDDAGAPAFTVLADADGNRVCVCTSLGRG
ncbi:SDR family NAD(P)-dependent oxidoreductase [Nakamurella flavida]|uniref:Putative pterin-4-alpha-carbinolamine dehydratase n=1 Tax=Nakamurella flavida TaxID=363630 RepID=A0A938YRA6_9ACTN|nr:SDR family NAD(P)-dependent oxidoreductase [Nakamurella flavida]MBM9478002.1 SDR family NAD(P)-dependent oxidoreductase [Nakamurella flavida]MDP9778282.1 NAD(P)-dependent dehydrogenase (short-subunit alcohol dehydrogenase family) [Nakamurella flavida]